MPNEKYDQRTSPGMATRAMTADEFKKLPTVIPLRAARQGSVRLCDGFYYVRAWVKKPAVIFERL